MTTPKRPSPPPLEFREPYCSMCFEETRLDDDGAGFHCEGCQASWSLSEYFGMRTDVEPGPGEWEEPYLPQCSYREPRITSQIFRDGQKASVREVATTVRCLLSSGHEGDHVLGGEGEEIVRWIEGRAPNDGSDLRPGSSPEPMTLRGAVPFKNTVHGPVEEVLLPKVEN